MVRLFEQNKIETAVRSSKGNQLKWRDGDIWYKADYTGYEGLAEYMISHLLKKTSLQPSEYVLYDLEMISYGDNTYNGVSSRNFLKENWQLITLERLFKNVYGRGLNEMIYSTQDIDARLRIIVSETERLTGIKDFGKYMAKMLTIDAFFLNEDRHTHNIAVLMSGSGEYAICPFFDQGAGLLADTTMDYPLSDDPAKLYKMIDSVKSKTFCDNFLDQLDAAERLYGRNIEFYFGKKDIEDLLEKVPAGMYSEEILNRVRTICFERIRQFDYLFSRIKH
ncbi:MAG: hypothetical protein K5871_08045 [Lachnospiraceae bacterium]|nr:hypothetical protein [Lachnospiraceae bacterium]